MTTRVIMRSGLLSRVKLMDAVYDFCNDGETTDEEIADKTDEIVIRVNQMLPGSLYWSDETSELWANAEDETRIDERDLGDLIDLAFEEVMYE